MQERSNPSNKFIDYIDELEEFVGQAERDLNDLVVNKLNWKNLDLNEATSDLNLVCLEESYNEKLQQKCKPKNQGFHSDEKEQAELNSLFKFELDIQNLNRIFESDRTTPFSLGSYLVNFTPEERLHIHNHALEHFMQLKSPYSLSWDGQSFIDLFLDENKDDDKVKNKYYSDLLAELRDHKRRRKSYRKGKAKATHTELMRELIQSQMEMLYNIEKLKNMDSQIADNANKKIDKNFIESNNEYAGERRHKKRRSRSRSNESSKKYRARSRSRTKSNKRDKDDKSRSPRRSHKKKHKNKDKKKKKD